MHVSRLLMIAVACAASTLAFGLPEAKAAAIVNSWSLTTVAQDTSPVSGFSSETKSKENSPFAVTSSVMYGGSSSETVYDFLFDAAGGAFNMDFDHERAGSLSSYAQSHGVIIITVTDVDMLYDFSGEYSMTGAQRIFSQVQLNDTTDSATVFTWLQESRSTSNESFIVGQGGGDSIDFLFGSPSGTLLAGHTYQMHYNFFIQAVDLSKFGAIATGDLQFNITPIPVPSGTLLGIMGFLLLGWFTHRQRRRGQRV